jgi:tetratricopeptide (TPR) repeat protein
MFQPVMVRRMRRGRSLAAGFAAVFMCCVLAFPALGATDDKATAKAHYEAATRLYDVHEYGDALKEYKAGYLTKPDPSFLFNIGQCYKKLGMSEQARQFFREYLKKAAPDDPNRAQAEARIRELDAREAASPAMPGAGDPATRAGLTPPAASPGDEPKAKAAFEKSFEKSSEKSPALPFSAAPANTVGVDPAGVDLSASAASQPAGASPAFYKAWWFWSGVGAVVVAGTVTAVVLSRSSSNTPNVSGTTLGTRTVLQ